MKSSIRFPLFAVLATFAATTATAWQQFKSCLPDSNAHVVDCITLTEHWDDTYSCQSTPGINVSCNPKTATVTRHKKTGSATLNNVITDKVEVGSEVLRNPPIITPVECSSVSWVSDNPANPRQDIFAVQSVTWSSEILTQVQGASCDEVVLGG